MQWLEGLQWQEGAGSEGDRFFDRETDLELLEGRVRNGSHTLLVAPRRMGKTSLVRELLRKLRDNGELETVYVDLEDALDPCDAIASFATACASVTPNSKWLRSLIGGATGRVEAVKLMNLEIKLRAALDDSDWPYRGNEIFENIALTEKPVLLAIDELPLLVNRLLKGADYTITPERRVQVDRFMSWLRKNAQAHQGKVCLIVTGSVGLEPVLRQAQLSALANVYEPYELGPWSKPRIVCNRWLTDTT